MKYISIFIFLIMCGCSFKNDQQVQSLPQSISTPAIQENVLLDPKCQNVANIIGFADVNFGETTVLAFYPKPNSSEQPAQTLRFYNDTTISSFRFRAVGEKTYPLLQPDSHNLDYHIFELEVINKRDGPLWDWLEVVVDDQTKETLWVQSGAVVSFQSWFESFEESFSVERLYKETNPSRREPSETAEQIEFDGKDRFKVKKMQGDWILVVQQDELNDEPPSGLSGWIKWRDETGCLLVYSYPYA